MGAGQSSLAGNQLSFILVLKERHEWRRKISWKWAGTGGDTAIYGSWGPRGGRYGLRWPRFTASVPALIFPRLLVFGNLSWTLKKPPWKQPKGCFWARWLRFTASVFQRTYSRTTSLTLIIRKEESYTRFGTHQCPAGRVFQYRVG